MMTPRTANGMNSPPVPPAATVVVVASTRTTKTSPMSQSARGSAASQSTTDTPGPSDNGSSKRTSEATANTPSTTPPTATVNTTGNRSLRALAVRINRANSRPPNPASTPTATAPTNSAAPIWRTAVNPRTGSRSVNGRATNVRYPDAAASRAGSSARWARSSRYGASRAKTTPVAGAWKMAATPAAAPAVRSNLPWSRASQRRRR
jgi:hypothetical protein